MEGVVSKLTFLQNQVLVGLAVCHAFSIIIEFLSHITIETRSWEILRQFTLPHLKA
jgi:hypothetical protein